MHCVRRLLVSGGGEMKRGGDVDGYGGEKKEQRCPLAMSVYGPLRVPRPRESLTKVRMESVVDGDVALLVLLELRLGVKVVVTQLDVLGEQGKLDLLGEHGALPDETVAAAGEGAVRRSVVVVMRGRLGLAVTVTGSVTVTVTV